jgi:hypothetical protein
MRPINKTLSIQLTRREFLQKASAVGMLAMMPVSHFLQPVSSTFTPSDSDSSSPFQGRVIGKKVIIYEKPSFKENEVRTCTPDEILEIASVIVGDEEPAHNRVWYEVKQEGFVHSGSIQPVSTLLNPVNIFIPKTGLLAEISVPYADAIWHPEYRITRAYRLYYGSTFWIDQLLYDAQGKAWYHIPDDRWGTSYYVEAEKMHIIETQDIMPISPKVPADQKYIDIDLKNQTLIAYEEDVPVFMTKISSGAKFSNGNFSTPAGTFITNRKRASRHMVDGEGYMRNSYDLPGVPWVSYLTRSGIAIHGTYWHNDFGKPRSHGCINVPTDAARWVYRWTLPQVPLVEENLEVEEGTEVRVF